MERSEHNKITAHVFKWLKKYIYLLMMVRLVVKLSYNEVDQATKN